ncbi:ParA family protein [Acidithiobacillus thiooxidans]|uniref:ParA family protein n=1 Tax=Acidithiobacillus thiooxidans TaxID=930 RepID=UPI001C074E4F|nr:ParA family protein [Acidithiobacillus thiooxidans]MBU2792779.1 ParA family protein [Acidithiobacillus thiooxidans]
MINDMGKGSIENTDSAENLQGWKQTEEDHYFALIEQPKYMIGSVAKMLRVKDHVVRDTVALMGLDLERGDSGRKPRLFHPDNVFDIADFRRRRGLLPWDLPPATVVVYSAKGGVGKTTLAAELAVQWAFKGLKVLAIDLDTQGNLTQMMGYDPELERDADQPADNPFLVEYNFGSLFTIPPILPTPVPLADVIKKPYGENGPHLIPADVTLANLEDALLNAQVRDFQVLRLLQRGLTKPTPPLDLTGYDIILFDAPPSTSMLTNTTLLASDLCISPVALDALSFKGLSILGGRLINMREQVGRSPSVVAVPTFYRDNRRRVAKVMERLKEHYGNILSTGMIRESEEFKRSSIEREIPISLAYPGSKVAIPDLQAIADEMLGILKNITENRMAPKGGE